MTRKCFGGQKNTMEKCTDGLTIPQNSASIRSFCCDACLLLVVMTTTEDI